MDAANGQKPLGGPLATGGGTGLDKNNEWQMELLMEKLRSKASAFKSLVETAKNLRMAMLDKRFALDSVEKGQLQKCLDTLQHSIKVTSLQSMVERLESLTRQLGLKFMTPGPASTELFISSDMFFLEVLLEPTGVVKDVKIHHEGKNEQQSCEELVSCLSRGDFVDFTAQLEGLASIYQLNADKKVKCKAFSALQSLEADLGCLAQLQTFMKEPFNLVHKSPVGILEPRKGGHAMKLTYFVSPYDLIDQANRTCDQLSPEAVISRKIGHSVTVCMEGSTAHKLPTSSIITVNRSPSGKNTPSYAPLTGANSSMLPACFVLKLAKKMPMCLELVHRIQKVTELECGDVSAPHSLLSLIVQHASGGQLDCRNNRGLYVTLPDQQHCYFMTENKSMEGVLVGSIPFTHPAHVPQILVYLRQQALFNTLLTSCVRSMARQELEHTTMFEVSALSWQHMSVSLEHPFEETMATAELDLTDISALKCKLYGVSMTNTEQTSEIVSKIVQRCLSIPVTMRALIKTWEGKNSLPVTGIGGGGGTGGGTTNSGNYGVNLGPVRDQNGHDSSGMPDFTNGETKIKHEPGLNGNGNGINRQQAPINQQQQSFLDAGTENSIGFPSFSGQSDTSAAAMLNPLQLGALLSQGKSSPVGGMSSSTPTGDRPKKSRKRKTADGMWRSPKSKSDDSGEILLESSSSDSTPLGTPTGRDNANGTRTPTPTSSATSFVTGLDLSNIDSSEIVSGDTRGSTDYDENESEVMEVHDLPDDYAEIMKRERKSRKNREEKKSPSMFEENKSNLVPPSVSITPISSSSLVPTPNFNSVLTGMGLERRPGIEIIPISSTPQTNLPSSITITPITGATIKPVPPDERRDRKKTSDDKGRLEKKRKRKREDSPMGPPDKLPPKQSQDPLSKPVSVSIKPTESQPNISSRPSSPATTLRKFNPSPTHTSPLALLGKSSPTLKQSSSTPNTSSSSTSSSSSSKSMPSPKHSPVYNSPKHASSGISASVSPKQGTSSPKHGGATSAGKPSMSALKSAANSSPSSGGKISSEQSSSSSKPKSSSSKEASRDKERKNPSSSASSSSSSSTSGLSFSGGSSGHQSPKTKSSSSKLKQIELLPNTGEPPSTSLPSSGSSTPPSGGSDLSKAATAQQQQARNRKGSLSAVIDKLKNAQHVTDDPGNGGSTPKSGSGTPSAGESGQKERPASSSTKTSSEGKSVGKNSPSLDSKNPAEYMVKNSSDGMKITINKTRAKDSKSGTNMKISSSTGGNPSGSMSSSSSSSSSGNGSPKTHTGLKPGVNSGPASKKPQSTSSMKVSSQQGGLPTSLSNKIGIQGQKISSTMKSTSSSGPSSSSGVMQKNTTSKSSTGSPKMSSSGATDLSRNRDKPRLPKSADKSGGLFGSKSTDSRKASPSPLRDDIDSERAFKLLAAHASMSSIPSFPPQLVVEGLIKQLDTKFQIPKLSARANVDSSEKKTSSEKMTPTTPTDHSGNKLLDSLSSTKVEPSKNSTITNANLSSSQKSTDMVDSSSISSRREIAQTKPDNLSSTAMPALNLSGSLDPPMIVQSSSSSTSSSSSVSAVTATALDSDVPTNLSMQPNTESRDVCKDLTITPRTASSSFLKNVPAIGSTSSTTGSDDNSNILSHINADSAAVPDLVTAKASSTFSTSSSSSSGNPAGSSCPTESLNLSTKPADAALNKYKSTEERKSLEKSQSSLSCTPTPSSTPSAIEVPAKSTTPIPSGPPEVSEMLLDFSTPKDVSKAALSTISERAMSLQTPVRRNTPPPPPPLPPPPVFPLSPSVNVHVVKSPAPSPRIVPPSPHSAVVSPCITDDELMDEALVGLSK